MDGWIIAFRLPSGLPAARRVRFQHKLWGRTAKSQKGKYTFHEAGLMGTIAHRRLITGVFLIGDDDAAKVVAFLREWKAIHYARRIFLEPGDEAALGLG